MAIQMMINAVWCLAVWLMGVATVLWLMRRGQAAARRNVCRAALVGVPLVLVLAGLQTLVDPSAGLWQTGITRANDAAQAAASVARTPHEAQKASEPDANRHAESPAVTPAEVTAAVGGDKPLAVADKIPLSVVSTRTLHPEAEPHDMRGSQSATEVIGAHTPEVPAAQEPARDASRWTQPALWLLLCVSFALLLRLVWRLVRLRRWRRTWAQASPAWVSVAQRMARRIGLQRSFEVMAVEELLVPAATGLVRPALLLPRTNPAAMGPSIRGILAHELGHLAGRDPAWNIIADAVTAIAWWCPFTWWLRHRAQVESELTADDYALSAGARPANLAQALANMAGQARSMTVAPVGVSGMACHLRRRISMMIDERRPHNPQLTRRWCIVLPVVACLLAAVIAANPLVGADEDGQPAAGGRPGMMGPRASDQPAARPTRVSSPAEDASAALHKYLKERAKDDPKLKELIERFEKERAANVVVRDTYSRRSTGSGRPSSPGQRIPNSAGLSRRSAGRLSEVRPQGGRGGLLGGLGGMSSGRGGIQSGVSWAAENSRQKVVDAEKELVEVQKLATQGKASPAELAIAEALVREARDVHAKLDARLRALQRIPSLQKEVDKAETALKRLQAELKAGKTDANTVEMVEKHLKVLREEYEQAIAERERIEEEQKRGAMRQRQEAQRLVLEKRILEKKKVMEKLTQSRGNFTPELYERNLQNLRQQIKELEDALKDVPATQPTFHRSRVNSGGLMGSFSRSGRSR